MESLERFQQSRAVIEDFSSQTLAAISTDFGRLYYISSLKNVESGRYEHEGLTSVYSAEAVQAALSHCHEELFSRILERPLQEQERDLQVCLSTAGDQYWRIVRSWQEDAQFQDMCPDGVPDYLHSLFCSNVGTLVAIFLSKQTN